MAGEPKVLLVDDDADVLQGLGLVLRGHGFKLLSAWSASAALELLAREPVDLVISDHQMPGLSGLELLREVARLYPATARVMLSGRADFQVAVEAINGRLIHQFVAKPCTPLDLRMAAFSALQQVSVERENRQLREVFRAHPELRPHAEPAGTARPPGAAAPPKGGRIKP